MHFGLLAVICLNYFKIYKLVMTSLTFLSLWRNKIEKPYTAWNKYYWIKLFSNYEDVPLLRRRAFFFPSHSLGKDFLVMERRLHFHTEPWLHFCTWGLFPCVYHLRDGHNYQVRTTGLSCFNHFSCSENLSHLRDNLIYCVKYLLSSESFTVSRVNICTSTLCIFNNCKIIIAGS